MKCEHCKKEIKEDFLVEFGNTPEEQTINHKHLCKKCFEKYRR